ncbi:VOC family protein [uncultured Rikenella sp.]|uniref:VOC family protein n=1 Tax=uncultured Rikenella sp. TaxID=368003 RepID=UPI00345CA0F5
MPFTVGSEEAVHTLTEHLGKDGYRILSEPSRTGDGFYESSVADPEGNPVEICA